MRLGPARRGGFGFAIAAGALLALDVAVRLAVGEPYPGATFLLLAACGISLLPFLPRRLATPSLRAALVPILALGSFSILLTTTSLLGVRLTELSIRLSVAALVVALAAAAAAAAVRGRETPSWPARREGVALVALAGVVAVSLAASWEVVDPFPPPGSDWAYYLLYADEVEEQRHLLIDNPHAVGEGRSLGNYPGIGAVYGSFRILDGVSSRSLAYGLVLALALTPLALYAAVAPLWGVGAGLVAAAAYAVAPIHLEPLYWHGLATTLALAFIPLTLLALGLLYRGERGLSVVLLLGYSLAGVAAMHSVSAGIVALVLAIVLVAEVVLGLVRRRGLRAWWRDGLAKAVLAGCGAGLVLGAGVLVHLRVQGADAGSPVSYRFFDREWIDADTVDYYFSWRFLVLVGVGIALVLATRSLRRDASFVPVAALALTAVLVSQAWRLEIPFEYRRVVYYLAVPMAVVIGVASVRLGRRWPALVAYAVVLLAVAQVSIGLRLPERLLEGGEPRSVAVDRLEGFAARLDADDVIVTDRCWGVRVPYFVRKPTLVANEEWQVGFTKGLPAARDARTILEGAPEGRRLVREYGVRYAVLDPSCTGAAGQPDGTAVVLAPGLLIVDLT